MTLQLDGFEVLELAQESTGKSLLELAAETEAVLLENVDYHVAKFTMAHGLVLEAKLEQLDNSDVPSEMLAPYKARFKEWADDQGLAYFYCSDGQVRQIPIGAVVEWNPIRHPEQATVSKHVENDGGEVITWH